MNGGHVAHVTRFPTSARPAASPSSRASLLARAGAREAATGSADATPSFVGQAFSKPGAEPRRLGRMCVIRVNRRALSVRVDWVSILICSGLLWGACIMGNCSVAIKLHGAPCQFLLHIKQHSSVCSSTHFAPVSGLLALPLLPLNDRRRQRAREKRLSGKLENGVWNDQRSMPPKPSAGARRRADVPNSPFPQCPCCH